MEWYKTEKDEDKEPAWKVGKCQDQGKTRKEIQTSSIWECNEQDEQLWTTKQIKTLPRNFTRTSTKRKSTNHQHAYKIRSQTNTTLRPSIHNERCQGQQQPIKTQCYSTSDQLITMEPMQVMSFSNNHITMKQSRVAMPWMSHQKEPMTNHHQAHLKRIDRPLLGGPLRGACPSKPTLSI